MQIQLMYWLKFKNAIKWMGLNQEKEIYPNKNSIKS